MQKADIFTTLLCIQDRYIDFFIDNKKTIIDYLEINWDKPLKVSITDDAMPVEILKEIEETLLVFNIKN